MCTPREQEVFQYLLKNYTTKEIAYQMKISEKTVRNHISNVILKLNVTSRTQAVLELLRCHQIELNE
ncbi:MAG: LuxR C-terminal-related transcriptional regulator [Traorella sp.]